jgi:hypothetical protein
MNVSRGLVVNVLVLALGGASLVAVLATTGSVTTKDSAGREQNLLPVFRTEDVLSLELTANGQKIRLERGAETDGGASSFELVEPVKELADAATVDKFLVGLGGAKALRPVADTLARSALGLENPAVRIVVKTGKVRYELGLGGPAPTPEGSRYLEVKIADATAKIFLVAKSVAEDLAVDLDAFRLRSIVSVSEADVTQLSIKSAGLDLDLVRGSGRGFLLDDPPNARVRADREMVGSLFFQLGRLTANRFLTNAEAEAALGANRAHFVIQTKDPSGAVSFDAGGSCPGDDAQLVILRRTPSLQGACVSRELDATLGGKRDAFVDDHAFSMHVDEVEEFVVARGDSKLRLVRKGTAFVLHTKTDTDVELIPGNERISDALEAHGTRVDAAKLGELGLEPAQGKVTLRSSAGREADVAEEVVRVGNKDHDGNLFVYREADGVTLLIPRDSARAFALDSTLLYPKKLSEFGPSSFISAEITRGQTHEVLSRGTNGALHLDSPKGFDIDGSLAADVVQALGALTAERFVADTDDGSFGLSHSSLTVHFAFQGEAATKTEHTLRFGAETTLGVYASLDQNGPVFVLPRTVLDTLETLLVDRSTFSADPAGLGAITLESNGRTLRFERRGEHLEPVPANAFPEDRLPDLLESLANLRPEAALHTGPAELAEGFSKPIATLHLSPKVGPARVVTIGAGDSWRAMSVFYLRVAGVDATYVIAQSKVRAVLAAF